MASRRRASLAVVALVFGWSISAAAQEPTMSPSEDPAAPASPPPATPPPEAAPAPAAPPADTAAPAVEEDVVGGEAPAPATGRREETEEIVVTGSRIRRKDLATPAPVTVVDAETLEESGKVAVGDFLQALPEQGGGVNPQLNNGGDGSSRLNLRTLGVGRTLVLLNGRRFVPAGGNDNQTDYSAVDLNAIPSAAIDRIEVLKDGASAVYGSDAIAGVVNIITKRNFSGTDLRASSGISSRGDGQFYDLGLTTGQTTDRGSVMFSAGFTDQTAVMARNRSYSSFDVAHDFATGTTFQAGSDYIPGAILFVDPGAPPAGNAEWTALLAANPDEAAFTRDLTTGQWRPYRGNHLATDALEPGDGFNYQQFQYLSTPNRRLQLFSSGDLRIGGNARGYFEASYVNRQSTATGLAPEPFDNTAEGITISKDNRWNPFGADFTADNSLVGRRLLEFGGRSTRSDVDTIRGIVGVDGTFPEAFGPLESWTWDASFNYGRTTGTRTKRGNLRRDKFAAAVGPSYLGADGQYHCGSGPTEAGGEPFPGCVPLNLFGGPGTITPDQQTALAFEGTARNRTELKGFQAIFGGELFPLLSERSLGLAVGYEFRDEAAEYLPDPLTASGDATGNKGAPTRGSYDVHEAYAELSIPILSAIPYAESVEALAAARYSNYSTFGSKTTYKLGARWSVWNDLTFRGTFSTAYRAPSVGDLFQGTIDNFDFVSDPCSDATDPIVVANCAAAGVPAGFADPRTQLRVRQGGNPDLEPETADIFTLGAVILPRWVQNLSVAVDYWNIDLDHTILTGLGGDFIMESCYSGTNPALCPLVTRASSGLITEIRDVGVNIGATRTSGVDVAARYTLPSRVGRWGFNADATYLINYRQTQPDGRVYSFTGRWDDSGDIAYPRWKGAAGVTWGLGGLGAGLNGRFVSGFRECADSDGFAVKGAAGQCNEPADPTTGQDRLTRWVSPYALFDAFVSYDLRSGAGRTGIAIGVQNLLDEAPNQVYSGQENHTDYALYDFIGRMVYVRLTHAL